MKPSARNSGYVLLPAAIIGTAVLFYALSPRDPGHGEGGAPGKDLKEHADKAPAMISPPPGPPNRAPSIEELKNNPYALDPAPLQLTFNAPPFERQGNGTIHKKDVMEMLDGLNEADHETTVDLQLLRKAIGSYYRIFQQNPVAGENREVVQALTGGNLHRLVFINPLHSALNERSELLDRWGTPFRFHPVSRSLMEFSSAGPDGSFGTNDDVILEEGEPLQEKS